MLKKVTFLFDKVFFILDIYFRKGHVGKNCRYRGKVVLHGRGHIEIGDNLTINSGVHSSPISQGLLTSIFAGKNGNLLIANSIGISYAVIYCDDQIVIEDDVMIGAGCKIMDTDFHPIEYAIRMQVPLLANTGKILIKRGAFIGSSSIILKGIEIGEKSVIGAGSVVTQNIPSNEVWAGNPARFIKKIIQ